MIMIEELLYPQPQLHKFQSTLTEITEMCQKLPFIPFDYASLGSFLIDPVLFILDGANIPFSIFLSAIIGNLPI